MLICLFFGVKYYLFSTMYGFFCCRPTNKKGDSTVSIEFFHRYEVCSSKPYVVTEI